jgi:hypothetical protein
MSGLKVTENASAALFIPPLEHYEAASQPCRILPYAEATFPEAASEVSYLKYIAPCIPSIPKDAPEDHFFAAG